MYPEGTECPHLRNLICGKGQERKSAVLTLLYDPIGGCGNAPYAKNAHTRSFYVLMLSAMGGGGNLALLQSEAAGMHGEKELLAFSSIRLIVG